MLADIMACNLEVYIQRMEGIFWMDFRLAFSLCKIMEGARVFLIKSGISIMLFLNSCLYCRYYCHFQSWKQRDANFIYSRLT